MNLFKFLIYLLLTGIAQSCLAKPFKTDHWTTSNGVRVIFYQAMEVPMLDLSLAFAAGSAYDGARQGLSALTFNMMNQGNAGLSATDLANGFADEGSQLTGNNTKDMVVFNLRTLTTPQALSHSNRLFSNMIIHPDFPMDAFMREKTQLLMSLKQAQESPQDIANLTFFKTLYKNHPYAHAVNGNIKSLKAITRDQLIEFYKQYYVAENAVLVLVGAIDQQTAHQMADQLTRALPRGQQASILPQAVQIPHAEQKNIDYPSSQTMIRVGQIGIDHHNPNYFPLTVGNYIFGGDPLESRLGLEIREKRGLTYGIDSQFVPMPGEGPFIISLATKNSRASKALQLTQLALARFIQEGPNQEELTAAKQYLTGSFPLSLDSNHTIANLLLRVAFYQMPNNFLESYVDHIQSVTLQEVKQAFKQQVDLDKLVLIKVGRL
ncbi:MAG: insulinase family protein [Legionella sp.]|nr:insulinase family protein [Legionella sp.]